MIHSNWKIENIMKKNHFQRSGQDLVSTKSRSADCPSGKLRVSQDSGLLVLKPGKYQANPG